ncbi:protein YLS7-like [Typha latifolia]|uniref:protein YLS7-like n=1 Tax=Typha latifolia TaxID=4733 RepID=UPI003C2BB54C
MVAVLRSLFTIIVSVGGLALCLIILSLALPSSPFRSSLHGYLLGVDSWRKPGYLVTNLSELQTAPQDEIFKEHLSESSKEPGDSEVVFADRTVDPNGADISLPASNNTPAVDQRSCNLYHGKWVYDPSGLLYTNNTCPIITQTQNCQGNGRPDKEYERWRWKPEECGLPYFDARKFLELMKGKTLAFVGDSVARNQMESLICILWQVEAPKNRGNRRMQKWYFRSTSTSIIRIWSSWLVHRTSDPLHFAPEGIDKVHLDVPDETFMEFLPNFDVVVLSSGHWFAKKSAYILNGSILGGQLWWPKKAGKMQINNIKAFGVSVETCLTAIANHPKFTGLAIVRSYSPDHYEGGAWNTGGSCTGKDRPATKLLKNGFTDTMYKKQVTGFQRAVKKLGGGSRLRFMDITKSFGYRHDGHPGPYRSPDPNKVTRRGPNGEPPPQDCLHWCMPGPIDTWNEFLLEIIRREYEGAGS